MQHTIRITRLQDSPATQDLGPIGPEILELIHTRPCRHVPNFETDLGRGCKFIGGAFLMTEGQPAPNEAKGEPGVAFSYLIETHDGVPVCIREPISSDETPRHRAPWWKFWVQEEGEV